MPERLTYTVTEAAEVLGVSKKKVYELVRRGHIAQVPGSTKVLISRRRLEAWIDGTEKDAAGPSSTSGTAA